MSIFHILKTIAKNLLIMMFMPLFQVYSEEWMSVLFLHKFHCCPHVFCLHMEEMDLARNQRFFLFIGSLLIYWSTIELIKSIFSMIIMWLPNQSESVCNLLYKQKDWILTKQEVVKAIITFIFFCFSSSSNTWRYGWVNVDFFS